MKLNTIYQEHQGCSLEMLIGLVVANRMDMRWLGIAQKESYNALVEDIECLIRHTQVKDTLDAMLTMQAEFDPSSEAWTKLHAKVLELETQLLNSELHQR